MSQSKLSREVIEAAIEGFEIQRRRAEEQITELRRLLTGVAAPSSESKQSRRKFSPATLEKMREAQRRRWAKVRGESGAANQPKAKKSSGRRLSAAGRKAISEAAKKMWADRKANAA